MARITLPLHSYNLRSAQAAPSRLVNCYAEKLPPDAKTPYLLNRAPAAKSWTTVGTGPIAGMHAAMGYLFVVSGPELWRVDANKAKTLLGSVGSPGNIDIDSNTSSIVVVNEPDAFYWDGTVFGQITDADFTSRGAGDVEFLNNYLLFREPNTGRFFGAELGSATSYDALDFATAEGSPDEMVGFKVDHLQALLFGELSTEIWQNDAAAGAFPFARAINGFIELGCLNGKTIAKLDNSVFWLASDFTVRRLDGVTPIRVSTHAIEQKIVDATISTAVGWTYTQDGHLFYVLTFSEGTFVYDATTQAWHERQTYAETKWNLGHPVSFLGLTLIGDTTSNKIAELDPSTYADFGVTQRMEFTYQPIYAEQNRAFHDRLEMVFEVGVGLTTGQGADPQVMLDYSDDGGKTFTSMPTRSLGAIGAYQQRVIWNALGSARQRVYRGAVSDPVRVTLVDTQVEVRGGRL
jgi:hypothetical protein